MSTSYNTYLLYGLKIKDSDLITKTPNPLFGKYKFDPESGDKVEEFISDEINIDDIELGDLDIIPTENYTFIGKTLRELGEYDDVFCNEIKLSEKEEIAVQKEIKKCLDKVKDELANMFDYYIVWNVS